MKYIKKVSVAQLQSNTGTIIDSMTSGDDHHTNAPSIDAVDNFVTNVTSVSSYSITPSYPGTGHSYILKKIGNLVVFTSNVIFLGSITANTWTNLATIPSECIGSVGVATACTIMDGNTGNIMGYGRVEAQTNGNVRVKSNVTQTFPGFTFAMCWTV